MKNQDIAAVFTGIADLLEILGENPFRINSYRRAARVLEEMAEAVEDLAAAGELQSVPGIGESSAGKIVQYLQTGRVAQYEELQRQVPPGLPGLLEVAGLGPKTAAKLWKEAGVTSLDELRKALEADEDRLLKVPGLGAKKLQQLRESLSFRDSAGGRIRLGEADALAQSLLESVRAVKGVRQAVAAGSLRRGRETIGDIDLLCEAPASAAEAVIGSFTAAGNVRRVLARGTTKGSVVLEGDVQADLRVVPAKSFGAALAYFTGSKAHNVRLRELAVRKGLKLNEYGLFRGEKPIAGKDEPGIHEALGLAFIPPELREDRGEVQAAAEGKLPRLLEPEDIRGDLHLHTRASDGTNTI